MRRALGGSLLIGLLVAMFVALSHLPLRLSEATESALTVTFRNSAPASEVCREPAPAEKAATLPHMRRDRICERDRAATRLRVVVDGRELLDRAYPPLGLRSDGASVALETFPVAAGRHEVGVFLADTGGDGWSHRFEQRLDFPRDRRRLVEFRRDHGFTAY